MQIKIESAPVEELSLDALAVICFESNEDPPHLLARQNGWLDEILTSGEFSGKLYEIAILHRPQGIAAKRLVIIGGGKRATFSSMEARRVAGSLVGGLKTKGVHSVALLLRQADGPFISAVVEGAILGDWEADKYKSDPKKNDKRIDTFALSVDGGMTPEAQLALEQGRVIGEAQNLTRDLVNEPSNKLVPADLAAAARSMMLIWTSLLPMQFWCANLRRESDVLSSLQSGGHVASSGVGDGVSTGAVFADVLLQLLVGIGVADHRAFVDSRQLRPAVAG